MYYVYAYCDITKPEVECCGFTFPGSPFYVGSGCRGRAFVHLKEARDSLTQKKQTGNMHKKNTINLLIANNTPPIVHFVKQNLNCDEARKIETQLIAALGRKCDGGCLTNITTGGNGGDTLSTNPRMKSGQIKFDRKGSKNPLYGKLGENNPKTKLYSFCFPSGEKVDVLGGKDLSEFLRKHKISRNAAFDVVKNRKASIRGITVTAFARS